MTWKRFTSNSKSGRRIFLPSVFFGFLEALVFCNWKYWKILLKNKKSYWQALFISYNWNYYPDKLQSFVDIVILKRLYISDDYYTPVISERGKSIFSFAFAIYFLLVTMLGMSLHRFLPGCQHCTGCICHSAHCEHSDCHIDHTHDNSLCTTTPYVDSEDSCPICQYFSMGQIFVSYYFDVHSFDVISTSLSNSSILIEAEITLLNASRAPPAFC